MTNAKHGKATSRWFTPPDWVSMARTAIGGRIELDPMSEPAANALVGAERYWTEADDCFAQPTWECETMLINPAGGLVAKAWDRLVEEYTLGRIGRAVWIGFSVEQLNILADRYMHPLDYSVLICRERIDFLTTKPERRVVPVAGGSPFHKLECGHHVPKTSTRIPKSVRCPGCVCDPEPAGSPSHGNYICALGVPVFEFEAAFAGRGKFSHGVKAVRR